MGNVTRTQRQGSQGQQYALTSDEDDADFWGFAFEAEGFFAPLPEDEGARRVRLVGCRPQGGLLKSASHIGSRRALAGNAMLHLLDAGGVTMGSYFVGEVTVVDTKASTRGEGLVDLTVTLWCDNALAGADAVWDLIRKGRLSRAGLWHGLGPEDRRAWLSVALWSREYQRQGRPDRPSGQEFTLDGRHIVDRDSFYCALGEAINGPGGYFGWNLDAVIDCLRGGWGATAPFTLLWNDSAEAIRQLTERLSTEDGDVTLFDVLLRIFEEGDVRVVLR
ncbi:barstar family protein [Kitasatospora sp. NPDC059722]|uniref:barstar family protein n=1 Tax=unclassified Kitasatospora TaxID=2633591 RepID=UPI003654587F